MNQDPNRAHDYIQAVLTYVIKGGTLGELSDYSERELEVMYVMGTDLYAQSKYEDAAQVFAFLMESNYMDRRFSFSVAACMQVLGRYEDAIFHYTIASLLDCDDPYPTFHTAECMCALKMYNDASQCFKLVEEECTIKNIDLGKRATVMLNKLRDDISL